MRYYITTYYFIPKRTDRTNSGGGLLIYSKEDIGVCRKHELENDIDETIWIEVHAKGHSFLLCNTYRPEWTDSEYWARLNHAIGLAYQVNENIVISGDLNSDLMSGATPIDKPYIVITEWNATILF